MLMLLTSHLTQVLELARRPRLAIIPLLGHGDLIVQRGNRAWESRGHMRSLIVFLVFAIVACTQGDSGTPTPTVGTPSASQGTPTAGTSFGATETPTATAEPTATEAPLVSPTATPSTATPPPTTTPTATATAAPVADSTCGPLLGQGDDWSYLKGVQQPGNWTLTTYNASDWAVAPGPFGYGEGYGEGTVLSDMQGNYGSLFLRGTFQIEDPALLTRLVLNLDFDDGFVAYLNGAEVARRNIPAGAPNYSAGAIGYREASAGNLNPEGAVAINVAGAARQGENSVAIMGVNRSTDDDDFFLSPSIEACQAPAASVLFAIAPGESWRYFKGTTEPPADWKDLGFNDSGWQEGMSAFGYGDDGLTTILDDMLNGYSSLYVRRSFEVADPEQLKTLMLSVDYDDAFVAYINGTEVARGGIGGAPPQHIALAPATHEAVSGGGGAPGMPAATFDISGYKGLLVPGANVLAIQGHNSELMSNDFTLGPSLVGMSAAAGMPLLIREPYLAAPGADSMTVAWATIGLQTPSVMYQKRDGSGQELEATGTSRFFPFLGGYYLHEVRLRGLDFGAEYNYRVLMDGAELAAGEDMWLRTASPSNSDFKFGVLADTGTGLDAQRQVRDQIAMDDIHLLMLAGDAVEGGAYHATYQDLVYGIYQDILKHVPYVPVVGNEDFFQGDPSLPNGKAWQDMFTLDPDRPAGKNYYSFNYGNVHFVLLDGENINAEQVDWLWNDLNTNGQPWTVVSFHRAPFDDGSDHPILDGDAGARAAFVPTLEQFGVDIVFNGNNNVYARTAPLINGMGDPPFAQVSTIEQGGIVYITTGGGGDAQLDTLNPDLFHAPPGAVIEGTYHYVRVTVDGCVLRTEAVDVQGNIHDPYEINKCG
jgi:predicted phosphodiesterase